MKLRPELKELLTALAAHLDDVEKQLDLEVDAVEAHISGFPDSVQESSKGEGWTDHLSMLAEARDDVSNAAASISELLE